MLARTVAARLTAGPGDGVVLSPATGADAGAPGNPPNESPLTEPWNAESSVDSVGART